MASVSPEVGAASPVVRAFRAVAGQERALAHLRAALRAPVHAYLFAGPPGSGKAVAAQAFAAALLCPAAGCGECPVCTRVLAGVHPDVLFVERQGAAISIGTVREIRRVAMRSPNEGGRKVLILDEFHLVQEAGPAMLKVLEEPPESTVFLILAEHIPTELETIASRCVRIDFGPLSPERLYDVLVNEGVESVVASVAADGAGGRLDRARLIASDPGFAARRETWRSVPGRLDGTGATVAILATELVDLLGSAAVEPLKARHAAELAELAERVERTGERGSGRKELEDRQKRELRRLRTDELRFGLAVLSSVYRDALAGDTASNPAACIGAVETIRAAAESLQYNPGELLLLQSLLVRLPPLA